MEIINKYIQIVCIILKGILYPLSLILEILENKMNNIDLIELCDKSVSWEEAIDKGVALLVNKDIATPELADKIKESTLQYGPYYVLMPEVALAHTQFGPYNKKVGISLVVFDQPISFSDDPRHQVRVLFTLSATDPNAHMGLIQEFANVMGKEGITEKIKSATTREEVYELVKEFLN